MMTAQSFYLLQVGNTPLTGRREQDGQPDGPQPFGRTLRIALAMKGGVSLAVWIGGAVGEIDILRRIRIIGTRQNHTAYFIADPTDAPPSADLLLRADAYATLLARKGYDRVDIDVLAGASAGGLNAVLYGAAQRAGVSVERVLDVWLENGAIWKLLRQPGIRAVPSVLRGDGFFWDRLEAALTQFYLPDARKNEAMQSDQVIVDLSATISDPDYRSTIDTHEGRGHFHFVGSSESDPDEVPNRGIPTLGDMDSISRLAYAARSTSSFPGAFEPALIWSHESGDAAEAAPGDVDMSFVFNAQRNGTTPYRVIDGGVLDNIPIERALHAIGTLRSTTFATRLMIYLDPSPDASRVAAEASPQIAPPNRLRPGRERKDRLSHFVGVIRSGLAMRGIRESGTDEIEDLEKTRRALYRERARYQAMSSVAGQAAGYVRADRKTAYARSRAASDYSMLYELFRDPARWQLESSLTHRLRRTAVTRADLVGLDDHLRKLYKGEGPLRAGVLRSGLTRGSQALVDAAAATLNWVRALEQHAFDTHHPEYLGPDDDHGTLRSRIYRISREAREVRDQHFNTLLVRWDSSKSATENVIATADRWVTLEAEDSATRLWQQLDECVTDLREITARSAGFAASHSPWATFVTIAGATAADLAPFIAPSGVPDITTSVRFDTITASEPTSLADEEFISLRRSQIASAASGWLKLSWEAFDVMAEEENLPGTLDSRAKLAGSELGNFAAFFSRDWRRNDWWWGHMDAAAGIVRILTSLKPIDDPAITTDPTAAVQAAVLREAHGPERSATHDAPAMLSGDHTLANLSVPYLVAIASRAPRVALRALFGGAQRVSRILGYLLLPPLLVLAPFVLTPLRAALAAAVTASTLVFVLPRFGASHSLVAWVAAAIAALALLGSVVTEVQASPRRERLTSFSDPLARSAINPRVRSSRRRSLILLAATLLFTAGAVVPAIVDHGGNARAILAAAIAVVLSIVGRSAARSLPAPGLRGGHLATWLVPTALVLLVGGWAAGPFDVPHDRGIHEPSVWFAVAFGACECITAALVTWGWLDGRFRIQKLQLVGVAHWVAIWVIVGVVAAFAMVGVTAAITGWPNSSPPLIAVLAGAFVAGHVLWWLGEVWPPDYDTTIDVDDVPVVRG